MEFYMECWWNETNSAMCSTHKVAHNKLDQSQSLIQYAKGLSEVSTALAYMV